MRLLPLALMFGCPGPSHDAEDADSVGGGLPTATSGSTGPTAPAVAPAVVRFDTRDGVTLEADLYRGQPGGPGFVLLHMTPSGGWTRADWPRDFIDQLTARGWSVVAVDRRGAGGSGGVAVDAYVGERGRYDVEASVEALVDAGAGPIAIVGASNGTTSMIDYAIWAPEEGLPVPVALGFMTGGTYTENQHAMDALPPTPSIFMYATDEAEWSVAQQPRNPGTWVFRAYPGGAHGTKMFAAKPEAQDDLVGFFASVL